MGDGIPKLEPVVDAEDLSWVMRLTLSEVQARLRVVVPESRLHKDLLEMTANMLPHLTDKERIAAPTQLRSIFGHSFQSPAWQQVFERFVRMPQDAPRSFGYARESEAVVEAFLKALPEEGKKAYSLYATNRLNSNGQKKLELEHKVREAFGEERMQAARDLIKLVTKHPQLYDSADRSTLFQAVDLVEDQGGGRCLGNALRAVVMWQR